MRQIAYLGWFLYGNIPAEIAFQMKNFDIFRRDHILHIFEKSILGNWSYTGVWTGPTIHSAF